MSDLKLGIIGFGNIAGHHLAAVRKVGGAEVIASCNRSEAGRAKAQAAGVAQTFSTPLELVDAARPDALVVSVSVDEVFSVTKTLIPLGLPLLVEKPAGLSVAELEELAGLSAFHHTPVQLALNRRYYEVFHQGIAMAGGLDQITAVTVEAPEAIDAYAARGTFSDKAINGWLFANSIHTLDLLVFFGGRPVTLQCLQRPFGGRRVCYTLQGFSERGAVLDYFANWDSPGRWRLEVFAHDLQITYRPLEKGAWLKADGSSGDLDPQGDDREVKAGMGGQMRAFLESVRTGQPAPWPAADLHAALDTYRMIETLQLAPRVGL